MFLNPRRPLWIVLLGLSLPADAWAQRNHSNQDHRSQSQQERSGRRYSAQKPVEPQKADDADHTIARVLGNMNEVEAEIAHYAAGRSQIDAVSRFAKQQSKNHENFRDELQKFAPDAGTGIGRSDDSDDDARSADDSKSHGLNWQKVSREIANENLKTAKKDLREREGLDFEWAFVSQQKLFHDALRADLTVFRHYASSALRDVIDEELAEVKHDQQTIDRLIDRLKDEEQRQHSSQSDPNSDQRRTAQSQRGGQQAGGNQQRSNQQAGDRQNSNQQRNNQQRSNGQQANNAAESDFERVVRLISDQNGRPSLGIELDRRQGDVAAIAGIFARSPAAQAGLERGDMVLAVNGAEINSPDELIQQISQMRPGDAVRLLIARGDASSTAMPANQNNNQSDDQNGGRQQSDRRPPPNPPAPPNQSGDSRDQQQ